MISFLFNKKEKNAAILFVSYTKNASLSTFQNLLFEKIYSDENEEEHKKQQVTHTIQLYYHRLMIIIRLKCIYTQRTLATQKEKEKKKNWFSK